MIFHIPYDPATDAAWMFPEVWAARVRVFASIRASRPGDIFVTPIGRYVKDGPDYEDITRVTYDYCGVPSRRERFQRIFSPILTGE